MLHFSIYLSFYLSIYLFTLGGFVIICLSPRELNSWENLAIEKGRRKAERESWEEEEEGERRQTERGKVHPVDGGPAPLVFCEGEMLHNVY